MYINHFSSNCLIFPVKFKIRQTKQSEIYIYIYEDIFLYIRISVFMKISNQILSCDFIILIFNRSRHQQTLSHYYEHSDHGS